MRNEPTDESFAYRPLLFKNFKVMKDKERLRKVSRLKECWETQQLNEMSNTGLHPDQKKIFFLIISIIEYGLKIR